MNGLKDRVCIVTGCTSGIGRATAIRLAEEGAIVVGAGRRQNRGDELVVQLSAQGYKIDFFKTDISVQAETDALVEYTIGKYGRIDVLVNNAAASPPPPFYFFHDFTDEDREKFFRTNLYGTMNLTRSVIPHMIRNKRGNIVNLASIAAEVPTTFDSIYPITKGGIRMLTKTICAEYGPYGIRCNAVLPGITKTEMLPPDIAPLEEMCKHRVPVARLADASEIASAIAFLASDDASYVSGLMLVADGGYLCESGLNGDAREMMNQKLIADGLLTE